MSNVLGTINPGRRIADARPRRRRARRSSTAAQFVPAPAADVPASDADFLAFTGHKMCGPTGIGVLWGRAELLDAMPPFLGGGEMIPDVRLDGFTPDDIPWKFEAGTPPIAETIGLGAAVDYLDGARHGRRARPRGGAHALRSGWADRGPAQRIIGPKDAPSAGVRRSSGTGRHPPA